MRRLALITVIGIAILSLALQQSAADAPKFVSLEGRFSVSLPDRFEKQTRLVIPIPVGNAYGTLYEWQTKEGIFGVGYADSFELIKPEAVQQFFDGATERFRKLAESANGGGPVVKTIALDNYPGIEQRAVLSKGSFIQRTYLASRRIYQTLAVVKNSRDESTAVKVLDSFNLLDDAEITEEALKAGPGPLPQTPEAPRAGSDADDEGLRGRIKSIRREIEYLSDATFARAPYQFSLTTYNEKGNKLRIEEYDLKNNLSRITVYGYVDGVRVSASKYIEREYGPRLGSGGGGPRVSNRKMDPRYNQRFEFKYDEKKRLIEQATFLSNGDLLWRSVYKYDGNQKEKLLYSGDSFIQRELYILDDKGNEIERTAFKPDGTLVSKTTYAYEFDANGNWTKQRITPNVMDDKLRQLDVPRVNVRTITYY